MATRTITQKCGLNDCTGLVEPLETAFIQPPDCGFPIRVESLDTSTTCYPPDFSSIWGGYGYYSPGICPQGYSAGCTVSADGFVSDYGVQPDETAYWCVPSQWDCGDGRWATTASPKDQVPALQIRWKSSDLANLQTHPFGTDTVTPTFSKSATSAASRSTTTGPPSTSNPSPGRTAQTTSTSDPVDSLASVLLTSVPTGDPGSRPARKQTASKPLSPGAKAGIALGIAVALVIVGIVAAILRAMHRERRREARSRPKDVPGEPNAANLDGQPVSELEVKKEVSELEGKRYVAELNDTGRVPELDAERGEEAWRHQHGVHGGVSRGSVHGAVELPAGSYAMPPGKNGGVVATSSGGTEPVGRHSAVQGDSTRQLQ